MLPEQCPIGKFDVDLGLIRILYPELQVSEYKLSTDTTN